MNPFCTCCAGPRFCRIVTCHHGDSVSWRYYWICAKCDCVAPTKEDVEA